MLHQITKTILGEEITVYWSYRVMERIEGKGTPWEETNLYIVEAHYHEDGSLLGWTNKGTIVSGETLEDLRHTLHWMLDSLEKPILVEKDLLAQAEIARGNGDEDIFPGERLTMDEVLDSLGLEREDVEPSTGEWENEGGLPIWNGPDSP